MGVVLVLINSVGRSSSIVEVDVSVGFELAEVLNVGSVGGGVVEVGLGGVVEYLYRAQDRSGPTNRRFEMLEPTLEYLEIGPEILSIDLDAIDEMRGMRYSQISESIQNVTFNSPLNFQPSFIHTSCLS